MTCLFFEPNGRAVPLGVVPFLAVILLLLQTTVLPAQVALVWQAGSPLPDALRQRLPKQYDPQTENEQGLLKSVQDILLGEGYFSAAFSPFQKQGDTLKIGLSLGKKYTAVTVSAFAHDLEGAFPKPEQLLSPKAFINWKQELLQHLLHSGYPFAQVEVVFFGEEKAQGLLQVGIKVRKGPEILMGDVKVSGYALSTRFLKRLLQWQETAPFDQRKVDRAGEQIDFLDFTHLRSPPRVHFEEGNADLRLFLDPVPANEIAGLLGFANSEGQGLLTGSLSLRLVSPFKRGMEWQFFWQRFQPASPIYRFFVRYPYLFGSPVSFLARIDGLKQDTSFFNLDAEWMLQIEAGAHHTFMAGYASKRGGVQPAGQQRYGDRVEQLKRSAFRLGYRFGQAWRKLPEKARLHVELFTDFGNRMTMEAENAAAPQANYREQIAAQLRTEIALHGYIPVGKQGFSLNTKISTRQVFSERVLLNEAYRLGGMESLRGFPAGHFFASGYWLGNVDLQFAFTNTNFLYLFADYGYIQQGFRTFAGDLQAASVGLGLSLSVKQGQLQVVYGYGMDNEGRSRSPMLQAGFTGKF